MPAVNAEFIIALVEQFGRTSDVCRRIEEVARASMKPAPKNAFTVGDWSFRPSVIVVDGKLTNERTFYVYRLRDRSRSHAEIEQNGPAWIVHGNGCRARAFLTFAEARDHALALLGAK